MQSNSKVLETQVLVVGAGPVGLSLAIELGLRGVAVTLVEQRSRAGAQPRAKTTNVRSMQHLRRWGMADALRAAAPLPSDYPTDIVFSTTLFGRTLAVIENAFEGAKRRDPRFPEPAQWVPQYTVEKVLHDRIAQLPCVRVIAGAALESFTQSTRAVEATIRELATSTHRTIHADYLVGADGARSRVREVMGARMTGDHAFAFNYNLIVRIPELEQHPPARRPSCIGPSTRRRPVCSAPWTAAACGHSESCFRPASRRSRVKNLSVACVPPSGAPMQVEILERDLWAAHRLIADRYRTGAFFWPVMPAICIRLRRIWHESRDRGRRRSRLEACRRA